jgi:hypothetical protein
VLDLPLSLEDSLFGLNVKVFPFDDGFNVLGDFLLGEGLFLLDDPLDFGV